MKNVIKILSLLMIAVMFSACGKKNTGEEPYNRTGSKQAVENKFRNKVLAPYKSEGRFYATYALASIVKKPDYKGIYTVKFTNGPEEGKTIKTKDVIVKTAAVDPADLKKGDVVMYDYYNSNNLENSAMDRWVKAVVYDETHAKDGKVVVEFPRDRNDFMAGRETVNPSALRLITAPEVKDPRKWLP